MFSPSTPGDFACLRAVTSVVSDSLDPMDCSPPGPSVHGILQARILEWVAISSSRGSSRPGGQTHVSCVSCIGRWVHYHSTPPGKPLRPGSLKYPKVAYTGWMFTSLSHEGHLRVVSGWGNWTVTKLAHHPQQAHCLLPGHLNDFCGSNCSAGAPC